MLVPARCPECGGNINIDGSKKAAICEYCMQPFVVQDAINNFNTTYNITNNNEIKADVVNVYEGKNSDFVIEAGVLKKYQGESMNVIVPPTVKVIGRYAFSDMMVESVELPDSIVKIEDEAFRDCESLKSIKIQDGVVEIGGNAFNRCESLKSIVIPDSIVKIGHGAFHECKSLESIKIPDGVVKIELGAFSGCESLKSIIIPDSVVEIEALAFAGCESLKKVVLSNHLKSMREDAFKGCHISEEIKVPEGMKIVGFKGDVRMEGIFEKAIIPKDRKDLLDAFFREGCYEIVAQEDEKTVVERRNFGWDFIEIEGIRFNKDNTTILKKYIGRAQNVIIPEGVESIDERAFSQNRNLESIELPSTLTWIGNEAFANCEELQSIVIKSKELLIGKNVFSGCKKIKTVRNISAIKGYKDSNNSEKTFDNTRLHCIKEIFGDTELYRDFCEIRSICPECCTPLSLFGKCKNQRCPNYGKSPF